MSDFPSLSSLLIQGDDHRLSLDGEGYNDYYCQPKPTAKLLRFGSSTASNISPQQWAYAESWHEEMYQFARTTSLEEVKKVHTKSMIKNIRQSCQLPQNTHIQLADSGTDAHRLAMQHFCRKKPHAAWHIIMIDHAETGRGVPTSLCLEGQNITCENIAIRQPSGKPLPIHDIEEAMKKSVQDHIKQGLDVLLIMVDVSKTGYIAPRLETVLKLRQQQPQHIHILLDACQFRFSVETLNHYLQYDIAIAITGSKFLAAPSFCAALLIPNQAQQEQTPQPLGLLLRWHLALQHLQALNKLSTHDCATFMKNFSSQVMRKLQEDKAFIPLETPLIQRNIHLQKHWQDYPTIFPFFTRPPQGFVSQQHALNIFKRLQNDIKHPVQLGRPMLLHTSHAEHISVFRLCISAPLIIHAVQYGQQQSTIEYALQALQQLKDISKKECLD